MLPCTPDGPRWRSFLTIDLESLWALPMRQPLTVLAASAWCGIAIDQLGCPPAWGWLALLVAIIAVRLALMARPKSEHAGVLVLLMCLSWVCIGGMRHRHVLLAYRSASVLNVLTPIDEPTILVGVVQRPVRVIRDQMDFESGWISGRKETAYRTEALV